MPDCKYRLRQPIWEGKLAGFSYLRGMFHIEVTGPIYTEILTHVQWEVHRRVLLQADKKLCVGNFTIMVVNDLTN